MTPPYPRGDLPSRGCATGLLTAFILAVPAWLLIWLIYRLAT